ncbi:MAG: prolyl oligopeptidase family serine peptidase [Bdellovibrionales bacterium]|nr:prolyl oligopeptidase family serine peptidase [Bdellovibrionales bacterium]
MSNPHIRGALAASFLFLLNFVGCAHAQVPLTSTNTDPYLWLEEVEGVKALQFANAENAISTARLQGNPWYKEMEASLREILLAKDRIPMPSFRGNMIYNFWQDEKYVRGIWRRTSVASYKTANPQWETVLDLDVLAAAENANWVFKGANCLPLTVAQRCLVSLSNGGKDAVQIREFDLDSKTFVTGGFFIPEAKSSVSWYNRDQILVATDWGPGSMSSAGYARILKLSKRGEKLDAAQLVFEADPKYLWASASTKVTPHGTQVVIESSPSFFEVDLYEWDPAHNKVTKLNAPADADFKGFFDNGLLIQLRSDWAIQGQKYQAGDLTWFQRPSRGTLAPRKVFSKPNSGMIETVAVSSNKVLVVTLENVVNKVYELSKNMLGYRARTIHLPSSGVSDVVFADDDSEDTAFTFEDFLVPTSLYFRKAGTASSFGKPIKTLPKKFDSSPYEVKQLFATSKDGTKIPYFHISTKGLPLAQNTPTLLYGYGGFEVPLTPSYLSTVGKIWLARGGSYVLANIRGGGEFGPAWHQAALKTQRHKAFEDFIAVGEDLIARGLTSKSHLGIQGGSNGGLLVSTVAVQRPDLFQAVLCEVPLIDMLRYHFLLAGSSWVGEYGTPEEPAMAQYIRTYSPYQNLRPGVKYPEIFVTTSTKDDRVHPGHARKFVAKLKELNQPVLYYENVNGGHAGAANLEERVKMRSLAYSYLWEKLSVK